MFIHYPATRSAEQDIEWFDLTGDPSTPGSTSTPGKPIQTTDDEEPPQANVGIGILVKLNLTFILVM